VQQATGCSQNPGHSLFIPDFDMELALSLLVSSSRAALTTDSIISVMDVLLGFETKAVVLGTDDFFCSDVTSTPVTVKFCHKSNRKMTPNIQRDKCNTGCFIMYYGITSGPGSSVSIATGYGLDDPGIKSWWG
jgi:hypothetical protein